MPVTKWTSSLILAMLCYVAPWSPLTAGVITELESGSSSSNNSLATAEVIPLGSFTTPSSGDIFRNATNDPLLPAFAAVTIEGRGGLDDVDFYRFTGNAGEVIFIDIDHGWDDPALSLFANDGTLLAFNDDMLELDPGSTSLFDPFIGVYTLPASGNYFIAVSEYPNFPFEWYTASGFTPLTRPDGFFGGEILTPRGFDSSFLSNGSQEDFEYTLHLSRGITPSGAVPEPGTMAIFALGCGGWAWRRRQRNAS